MSAGFYCYSNLAQQACISTCSCRLPALTPLTSIPPAEDLSRHKRKPTTMTTANITSGDQGNIHDYVLTFLVDENVVFSAMNLQESPVVNAALETMSMTPNHTNSRNDHQNFCDFSGFNRIWSFVRSCAWPPTPSAALNQCGCIRIGGGTVQVTFHRCLHKAQVQLVVHSDTRVRVSKDFCNSFREELVSLGDLDSLEVVGLTLDGKPYVDGLTAHFSSKKERSRSPSTIPRRSLGFNRVTFSNFTTVPKCIYDMIFELSPQLTTLVITLSDISAGCANSGARAPPTVELDFPQVQRFVVAVGNGWNDGQVDAISNQLELRNVTDMAVIDRHTFDGSGEYNSKGLVNVIKLCSKNGSSVERLYVEEKVGIRFGCAEFEQLSRYCPRLDGITVPYNTWAGGLQPGISAMHPEIKTVTLTFSAAIQNFGTYSLASADKFQTIFLTGNFPTLQTIELKIAGAAPPNCLKKLNLLLWELKDLFVESGIRFIVVENFAETDDGRAKGEPILYPGGKCENGLCFLGGGDTHQRMNDEVVGRQKRRTFPGRRRKKIRRRAGRSPALYSSMCAARWQLRVSTNCPETPGCTRPSRWPAALLRGPARRV